MGFCNDITPECVTCFEVSDGNCNDSLSLSLGLTGLTTYYLNLTDKFDIITPLDVTTDALGDFIITQTWTEFFGAIEVEIYTNATRIAADKVSFIISGTSYDCLILK